MRAQVLRTLLPIRARKPFGWFIFSITCFRELQSLFECVLVVTAMFLCFDSLWF